MRMCARVRTNLPPGFRELDQLARRERPHLRLMGGPEPAGNAVPCGRAILVYEGRRNEDGSDETPLSEKRERKLDHRSEGVVEGDREVATRSGSNDRLGERRGLVAAFEQEIELPLEIARCDRKLGRPRLVERVMAEDKDVSSPRVLHTHGLRITTRQARWITRDPDRRSVA